MIGLYEIPGNPETAGAEGSTLACKVLLLLNRWRSGMSFRQLQDATESDADTLRSALLGLQRRERVLCIGRGLAAIWVLMDSRHFDLIRAEQVALIDPH